MNPHNEIVSFIFGVLAPWVEERLAQANPETLDRWAERLLEAATIEAVFEQS